MDQSNNHNINQDGIVQDRIAFILNTIADMHEGQTEISVIVASHSTLSLVTGRVIETRENGFAIQGTIEGGSAGKALGVAHVPYCDVARILEISPIKGE